MTIRRLFPYLMIIVVFSVVYWLTMVIPNHTLYMGYGQGWREVKTNNKLPLQGAIFIYGLVLAILAVNFWEIVTTKQNQFILRGLKSILTIMMTYLSAAVIFWFLDVKIANLFLYYRGTPAIFYSIATMGWASIGLCILEVLMGKYWVRYGKARIEKYIPGWLKLEKEPF